MQRVFAYSVVAAAMAIGSMTAATQAAAAPGLPLEPVVNEPAPVTGGGVGVGTGSDAGSSTRLAGLLITLSGGYAGPK